MPFYRISFVEGNADPVSAEVIAPYALAALGYVESAYPKYANWVEKGEGYTMRIERMWDPQPIVGK